MRARNADAETRGRGEQKNKAVFLRAPASPRQDFPR